MIDYLASIPERLAHDAYETDEEESHIEVHQEEARRTGAGKLFVQVCPAHVYSEEPDGTISVEYAACLECGTCLAVAPRDAHLALPAWWHGSGVPRRLMWRCPQGWRHQAVAAVEARGSRTEWEQPRSRKNAE